MIDGYPHKKSALGSLQKYVGDFRFNREIAGESRLDIRTTKARRRVGPVSG
jgi:hypothetical protein